MTNRQPRVERCYFCGKPAVGIASKKTKVGKSSITVFSPYCAEHKLQAMKVVGKLA